ncbi:MAG: hypothetical protein HQK53_07415 [Oligoflexia bacterium]|nr:hypothetical protein [Oligoflexia bacterium]
MILIRPKLVPIALCTKLSFFSRKKFLIKNPFLISLYIASAGILAFSFLLFTPFDFINTACFLLGMLYFFFVFTSVEKKWRPLFFLPMIIPSLFIIFISFHEIPLYVIFLLAIWLLFNLLVLNLYPLTSIMGTIATCSLILLCKHYNNLPDETLKNIMKSKYVKVIFPSNIYEKKNNVIRCVPHNLTFQSDDSVVFASCVPKIKDQKKSSLDFVSLIRVPLKKSTSIEYEYAKIGQVQAVHYLKSEGQELLLITQYFDRHIAWIDPVSLKPLRSSIYAGIDAPELLTYIDNDQFAYPNEFGSFGIINQKTGALSFGKMDNSALSFEVSPDKQYLWTSHLLGPLPTFTDVSMIKVSDRSVVKTKKLDGHWFWMTKYDEKNKVLLVTEGLHGMLYALNPETLDVIKKVTVGKNIRVVNIDERRNLVYLGGFFDDQLYILSRDKLEKIGQVPVGGSVRDIKITQDNRVIVGSAAGILEVNIDLFIADSMVFLSGWHHSDGAGVFL